MLKFIFSLTFCAHSICLVHYSSFSYSSVHPSIHLVRFVRMTEDTHTPLRRQTVSQTSRPMDKHTGRPQNVWDYLICFMSHFFAVLSLLCFHILTHLFRPFTVCLHLMLLNFYKWLFFNLKNNCHVLLAK